MYKRDKAERGISSDPAAKVNAISQSQVLLHELLVLVHDEIDISKKSLLLIKKKSLENFIKIILGIIEIFVFKTRCIEKTLLPQ